MASGDDITDLTRGVYRRLYAGFLRGRRINSVSLTAEAWFWRVQAAADDFGNLDGEPLLLHAATAGRRAGEVSPGKVATLVGELVTADLLRRYADDGEEYLHVVGFNALQPANRSGRRVKRCPHSPWDEGESVPGNPGESGGIRGSDSDTDTDTDSELKPAAQASAATAKRPAAAPPDTSAVFLTFPTIAGRKSDGKSWELRESYIADLSETFPGVDVRAEARKALLWVRAKDGNRKTVVGMRDFLRRWVGKAQDDNRRRGGDVNVHEDPKAFAREAAKSIREVNHA